MNHPHIKRRRPYCHEDDAPVEPVLHDTSRSPSVGLDDLSLSARERYILGLPTSNDPKVDISVPLSVLLGLNHQTNQQYIIDRAAEALGVQPKFLAVLRRHHQHQHHQRHKRVRLNPDIPMCVPFDNDPSKQESSQEKLVLPREPSRNDDNFKPFTLFDGSGWTSGRIAECLATMCTPCTSFEAQPEYQALPTSAPYDYSGERPPLLVDTGVGVATPGNGPFDPTPASSGQGGFFVCDSPALMAQYLPNYPSMQPSRVLGVQPTTSREGMVYPGTSPDASRSAIGLGIQGHSQLISPTDNRSEMMSMPFGSTDLTSPPFNRQGSFVAVPPRYSPTLQGYDVKGDPDSLMGRPPAFDMFSKATAARRGPFKDHDQREKTARTRKMGSCIRCRMQRIRCNLDPDDESGPCLTCKKVANNKIWRLSCYRWKITDVLLFKPGQVEGHEWTNRWKDSVVDDIGSWASSELKTICVTEGYTGQSVKLLVRRFQPQEGDKLERSWVSGGVKRSVLIPPYAIVDMDAAKNAFDDYIKKGLVDCCKRMLGPREKLLWRTYAQAINMMGAQSTPETERQLIARTLDLWMSVRLTTKSFEIVGDETLGMSRDLIKDQDNPLHGKIPLPPVMGAQIDSVLIHQIQHQLRKDVLERLSKLTHEKKPETWLTVYLVTFILLHNLALITKHDADYAKKHGMKRRFAREDRVRGYNTGANTLLAYFHYCNKGTYPFSQECKDQELKSLAVLDDSAIQFVHDTRRHVSHHKRDWELLSENECYENEYYYVSQLFEQQWEPRSMGGDA